MLKRWTPAKDLAEDVTMVVPEVIITTTAETGVSISTRIVTMMDTKQEGEGVDTMIEVDTRIEVVIKGIEAEEATTIQITEVAVAIGELATAAEAETWPGEDDPILNQILGIDSEKHGKMRNCHKISSNCSALSLSTPRG